MTSVQKAVAHTAYPGRCIIIGTSADGLHAVCAYSIMGRSVNSRNRVFVQDGTGIRTQAHDETKLTDPSLVIYAPVRVLENHTIVTNGDQTDTIYDTMTAGGTFQDALRTRAYEPDEPNWTPRISGLITLGNNAFSYKMNILKRALGGTDACLRFFYEYDTPAPGQGSFLHTYADDGDPLPSFVGEPKTVAISGDIDTLTAALWNGLNAENKVALFVRFIRLADGVVESRIVNKLMP